MFVEVAWTCRGLLQAWNPSPNVPLCGLFGAIKQVLRAARFVLVSLKQRWQFAKLLNSPDSPPKIEENSV